MSVASAARVKFQRWGKFLPLQKGMKTFKKVQYLPLCTNLRGFVVYLVLAQLHPFG